MPSADIQNGNTLNGGDGNGGYPELDALKTLWQQNVPQGNPVLKDSDIRSMIRSRSMQAYARIKRNLKRECWVGIGLIVVYIIGSIFTTGLMQKVLFISWVLALGIGLVLYPLFARYFKKVDFDNNATLLIELRASVSRLRAFLKLYLYITIVIFYISFVGGAFYGAFSARSERGPTTFSDLINARYLLLFFGLGLVLTAALYFPLRWYIRRLYGNNLDEMAASLEELEKMD